MKLRQLLASDVTASVVAHGSLLGLLLLFSEVHPFGAVTAEQIPVDIVTPQEMAGQQETPAKPEPEPTPLPDFSLLDKPAVPTAASAPTAAAPPPAPARPQKQAAAPPRPNPQMATAQPSAPSPVQPAPSMPAYTPPQPDLSIKYHVMLGLPPDMSPVPPAGSGNKADENFDAAATSVADVGAKAIAEFRRHLRTCSRLPAQIAATDDVRVKLRVFMKPDGKLAAEPALIEASASMKGPLLMQGAIAALQACQPYAMLPPDRYREWKVLDMSFTPQDFVGG